MITDVVSIIGRTLGDLRGQWPDLLAKDPKGRGGWDPSHFLAVQSLGLYLIFDGTWEKRAPRDPLLYPLDGVMAYDGSEPRYKAYTGTLPGGISFGDSQADVRKALGAPIWERAPSAASTILPPSGFADVFEQGEVVAHTEFHVETNALVRVTVMRAAPWKAKYLTSP